MAAISFYTDGKLIAGASTSGLAFFGGGGFGSSIQVGQYAQSVYISNGAGTVLGPIGDNVQYIHPNSGSINGAGATNLLNIPNKDATVNMRFTHDSAVRVENVVARYYDRVNINNGPSGVTIKHANIIHPSESEAGPTGSGDAAWRTIVAAAVSSIPLAPSPGISGFYAGNGTNSVRPDTQHDWHFCISISPDSIGSKTLALTCSLEYL
jgi:hypothetical protein